jgi:hypothetical protein
MVNAKNDDDDDRSVVAEILVDELLAKRDEAQGKNAIAWASGTVE